MALSVLRQSNISRRNVLFSNISIRKISTSQPRNIHPLITLFAKPISRVAAAILGRSARAYWKKLPQSKKDAFKIQVSKYRWLSIPGMALAVIGPTYGYYSHLDTNPLTGRERFLPLQSDQIATVSKMAVDELLEEHEKDILTINNPMHRRVEDVVTRILKSNEDIKAVSERDWKISVVDDYTVNAMVIPSGHIFVFTGMLEQCKNDDQLATILGHEIAHSLLDHTAENLNYVNFLNGLLIIPMAVLWAFIPSEGIAFITDKFVRKVTELIIELPYSRLMENEADEVGLRLAAKACFDVREAPVVWGTLHLQKVMDETEEEQAYRKKGVTLDFLSTHPSSLSREKNLVTQMPETLQIRSDHGCCSLPEDNPYENFKKFKTMIKDYQGNFNHDWDKRQILKNSLKKQDQKDEYVDDAYIVNHSKVEVLQKDINVKEEKGEKNILMVEKTDESDSRSIDFERIVKKD